MGKAGVHAGIRRRDDRRADRIARVDRNADLGRVCRGDPDRFRAPGDFDELHGYIKGYLGDGNKMGEGWLLTAEMLELIHTGVPNIVCTQPFGCLPNHIVGKGMIRKLKDDYPWSNVVAIDYDPGATRINQENRIKLMLANAKALAKEKATEAAPAGEQDAQTAPADGRALAEV